MPFIPVRRKRKTRLRAAALHDVKMPTLGLFCSKLWLDYKEIVVPIGGSGWDRSNPLPPYSGYLPMDRLFVYAIRLYQAYLSAPFKGACIYKPSCSQYSVEAIEKYGAWKGLKLSISRLFRCRPPYEGGHDPLI